MLFSSDKQTQMYAKILSWSLGLTEASSGHDQVEAELAVQWALTKSGI